MATEERFQGGREEPTNRHTWKIFKHMVLPIGRALGAHAYGHPGRSYGVAVVSVVLALGLAFGLQIWDDRLTLFAFYAAVVGSAWFGTGPGCLAVVLSVLAVQYFFTPPGWGFEVMPQDVPFMGTFIVCAVMTLAWASQRRRTELALKKDRDELEKIVQQRTIELTQANEALRAEMRERQAAETELREAEARLARTVRLTTAAELAGSIAHEINQPLAAIVANGSACVRFLSKKPGFVDDARAAAECIVSDGHRAGEVITRIRSLVQKQTPVWQSIDLNKLIREIVSLSRAVCERHSVSVDTELADNLPMISGDPIELQQVFINLVTNAIEAMAEITDRPRRLTVRSSRDHTGSIVIAFEDTGCGLDDVSLDHIFESFYTTKPEGMGLGLSISKSLVEAHGGTLSVTATDCGARFTMIMPAANKSE
jgi:C4-dicarboxylate-specific signal transduction histidine kinase